MLIEFPAVGAPASEVDQIQLYLFRLTDWSYPSRRVSLPHYVARFVSTNASSAITVSTPDRAVSARRTPEVPPVLSRRSFALL